MNLLATRGDSASKFDWCLTSLFTFSRFSLCAVNMIGRWIGIGSQCGHVESPAGLI